MLTTSNTRIRDTGWLTVIASLAAGIGVLLATQGAAIAACATLVLISPTLLILPRAVTRTALLAVLLTVLIMGRDFAYIQIGPAYVLDIFLVAFLLASLPELTAAITERRGVAILVFALLCWTLLGVGLAGVNTTTLRQGVITGYAVWVFAGQIAGRDEAFVPAFARVVSWGGLLSSLLLIARAVDPGGWLVATVVPREVAVAASLYAGFGLLLFLLSMDRARYAWRFVAVIEIAAILLAEVRSVWIALPIAGIGALLICRNSPEARLRFVTYPIVSLSIAATIGLVAAPARVDQVWTEARSVVSFSGGQTVSDRNAEWRLNNWRYAKGVIEGQPILGAGFGRPEVPATVCGSACDAEPITPSQSPGADLHNSWLAVAIRLGLPAFILVVAFQWIVIREAHRSSLAGDESAAWLLACQLLVAATALTSVVLEGPYMGLFFWFFGGLIIARVRPSQSEAKQRDPRRGPYHHDETAGEHMFP